MDFKKILFNNCSIDVEKSFPDALIFCTKEGKIQWVNDVAADIFETSKMHLLTSNISDFIENALIMIASAISLGRPQITKFNGKEMYYDMTAREIEDGYVLDFRDTQEAAHAFSAQEDDSVVNREKNNFLVKLANDLKSPLQSVVGFSQAMMDGLGGSLSIQQEKYVRIINKNSADLMYFISKLIEQSKTESDMKTPEKKPLDISALVNMAIKFNEQLYKDKDIKITLEQSENFKKMVSSDEEILKMILQNIIEIVFKSVDMGEVVISLKNPDAEFLASKNFQEGNYTLISVSSSAMLLSENDLDCMFDPYKIVDSTNRKNVLRAIILSSVKNLVQALNGCIWVESQILKSTSFNIIIPE